VVNEDAHRNCLNGHCYWTLRRQGLDAAAAHAKLNGLSVADRNEFLFREAGINFNNLPTWQRRGIGVYKEEIEVAGVNPIDASVTSAIRRRNKVDTELEIKEAYTDWLQRLIEASEANR